MCSLRHFPFITLNKPIWDKAWLMNSTWLELAINSLKNRHPVWAELRCCNTLKISINFSSGAERLQNQLRVSFKICCLWLENAFFACFSAYVGQPHSNIGWAKSMPFASINPTNPRTHPAQFGKKILRIDRLAKWGFFESDILWKFHELVLGLVGLIIED